VASNQPLTAPNDPAFTADKLRAIDPCGLLDDDTLTPLGRPSDSSPNGFVGTPSGFGNCDIDMKDFHSEDLSMTVMVGTAISIIGSRSTVSGMAVLEKQYPDECTEGIVTQLNPSLGIEVNVHTHYVPCDPALKIATAVINHVRTNPPKRQIPAGSLITVNPCGTVDAPTVAAVVGPAATPAQGSFYACAWEGGPFGLTVTFSVGDVQKTSDGNTTPQQIGLGGVTGYQTQPDNQSCEIGWEARPTGSPHEFEIVDVKVDNLGQQQADTCAKVTAAAKVVATKVPKPS
jgi:hypothetical protein